MLPSSQLSFIPCPLMGGEKTVLLSNIKTSPSIEEIIESQLQPRRSIVMPIIIRI